MKKYLALLLVAVVISLTFTGCYNPGTVMNIGGIDIPAGLYLNYQMNAAFEAATLNGAGYTVDKALLDAETEGVPTREWIAGKTLENLRAYAFIEKTFAEMELNPRSVDSMLVMYENTMQSEWNSYANYYTENGIGYATYERIYRSSFAREMIYEALYVEEGAPSRPSEDEIKAYFMENYTFLDIIKLENKDDGGAPLDDAGKEARMASAEEMQRQARNAAGAAESYFEEGQNPGMEAALQWYFADAGIAEEEQEAARTGIFTGDMTVASDSTAYDAAFLEAVFAAPDNDYGVYQDSSNTYLFCRRPVESGEDGLYSSYTTNVISSMKTAEFDAYVTEQAAALAVTEDQRAMKYYSPDKIRS